MSGNLTFGSDFGAAIMRTYLALEYQAETGNAASDDALGLHMVRSVASPRALSGVTHRSMLAPMAMLAMSAPAAAADEPPAVPKPGEPSFSDFAKLMKDAMKPPAEQIGAGKAPGTTDVGLEPTAVAKGSQYSLEQVLANYNALRYCNSMAQLWAGIIDMQNRITRKHPEPYKISDPKEALIAFADQADAAWGAMMGPLAGFYTFDDLVKSHYSKTVTRAEVHGAFFGAVFAGFGLPASKITDLDKILVNFVDVMKSTSISVSSEATTFNHVLRVHAMDKITLVDDSTNPVVVYSPVTTLIYLRVNVSSWNVAIGKSASVEHVNFEFDYDVIRCSLNVEWFNAKKVTFDKMMQMVTGHNLQQFADAITNKVEDTRPQ